MRNWALSPARTSRALICTGETPGKVGQAAAPLRYYLNEQANRLFSSLRVRSTQSKGEHGVIRRDRNILFAVHHIRNRGR